MSHISVRLVQTTLFELLHDHTALHFKALFTECQFHHTVGLQPEANLYIRFGNSEVIVCNVIVRPGIVFATCRLQRSIIVGYIHRTAKHQMFEQMGKASMFGMFVPGTYIINDVQCYHLSTEILVMHQSQTVIKTIFIYLHIILNDRMIRW